VPQNQLGKKVTIIPSFDLGPLNPAGKQIEGKPQEVQL
jgi:hypothetical protein